MHGTGDDNVHYSHTASLVDRLIRAGVSREKMEWRVYADANHDMQEDGADVDMYR